MATKRICIEQLNFTGMKNTIKKMVKESLKISHDFRNKKLQGMYEDYPE